MPSTPQSRVTRNEVLALRPVDSLNAGSMSTNTTLALTQVPPGLSAVSVAIGASTTLVSNIEFKLYAYANAAQSVISGVLSSHEIGSSTLVTTITLASTSVATGKLHVFVPTVAVAGDSRLNLVHGLKATIDVNANATTGATVGDVTVDLIIHQGP